MTDILTKLEGFTGDSLYHVDQDRAGFYGYLTERGELVEKLLPALIRVARAAEELGASYRYGLNEAVTQADATELLQEALQQLRDLGEGDK